MKKANLLKTLEKNMKLAADLGDTLAAYANGLGYDNATAQVGHDVASKIRDLRREIVKLSMLRDAVARDVAKRAAAKLKNIE
jgi:hypothetical protein